jgi:hypothetical protein
MSNNDSKDLKGDLGFVESSFPLGISKPVILSLIRNVWSQWNELFFAGCTTMHKHSEVYEYTYFVVLVEECCY